MNGAHNHLLVNHLPIIIPAIAFIVLIIGFIFSSGMVRRTAFFIFILGAVFAYVADETGGGAAQVLKQHNLAEKEFIRTHAETAETFAMLSYALAALSAVGIWSSVKRKSFAMLVAGAVAILSLSVLYYGTRTGNTGGQIRHTEIR